MKQSQMTQVVAFAGSASLFSERVLQPAQTPSAWKAEIWSQPHACFAQDSPKYVDWAKRMSAADGALLYCIHKAQKGWMRFACLVLAWHCQKYDSFFHTIY